MFPECSLDLLNIAMLREHSPNIPGILRDGWGSFTIKPFQGIMPYPTFFDRRHLISRKHNVINEFIRPH